MNMNNYFSIKMNRKDYIYTTGRATRLAATSIIELSGLSVGLDQFTVYHLHIFPI